MRFFIILIPALLCSIAVHGVKPEDQKAIDAAKALLDLVKLSNSPKFDVDRQWLPLIPVVVNPNAAFLKKVKKNPVRFELPFNFEANIVVNLRGAVWSLGVLFPHIGTGPEIPLVRFYCRSGTVCAELMETIRAVKDYELTEGILDEALKGDELLKKFRDLQFRYPPHHDGKIYFEGPGIEMPCVAYNPAFIIQSLIPPVQGFAFFGAERAEYSKFTLRLFSRGKTAFIPTDAVEEGFPAQLFLTAVDEFNKLGTTIWFKVPADAVKSNHGMSPDIVSSHRAAPQHDAYTEEDGGALIDSDDDALIVLDDDPLPAPVVHFPHDMLLPPPLHIIHHLARSPPPAVPHRNPSPPQRWPYLRHNHVRLHRRRRRERGPGDLPDFVSQPRRPPPPPPSPPGAAF